MIVIETDAKHERHSAGEINRAWRKAMLLGTNKDKHAKLLKELSQLPPGASLAAMPEPPPPRSHKYATGLAEFEQLEAELNTTRLWGQEQANSRQVAEATIVELKREFEQWRGEHQAEHQHVLNERDRALDELGDLKTRLQVIKEQIDRVFARMPPAIIQPAEQMIVSSLEQPPEKGAEHHD